MPEGKQPPEALPLYENGKHRRYNLLFTVNGGAFAIARLFTEERGESVLGDLTLRQLALGMIFFTIVMVADIFAFGENMRKAYLPSAFGWQGKSVLVAIGILISLGWFLVA